MSVLIAVLVTGRSSLLEVGPEETVGLCASTVPEIDVWFVVVPLSTIPLGEEDKNEDDLLEDTAEEMTPDDDVESCVLVERITEIEFALERRLVERDRSDVAEVCTVDVVICDGFDTTGLLLVAKAEDVLTVKLFDSDEIDFTEVSTVLVDCGSETEFTVTFVTALDPGAKF